MTTEWSQSQYARYMQTSMVSIDEATELCVEVAGNPDNPAILLIMGLGCQLLHWPDYFVKQLVSKGYYVIRYDNRDIGLSTKSNTTDFVSSKNLVKLIIRQQLGLKTKADLPYTLETLADDASKLLSNLDIDKAHIIGASMGGMVAQIFASKYAQQTLSLGLLFTSNQSMLQNPPGLAQIRALLTKPKQRTQEVLIQHGTNVLKTIGSAKFFNETQAARYVQVCIERSNYSLGSIHQFFAILASGSLAKYNAKISVPTVVVHGARDKLIKPSNGKRIVTKINKHNSMHSDNKPVAHFIEIADMAHDIPYPVSAELVNAFDNNCKRTNVKPTDE